MLLSGLWLLSPPPSVPLTLNFLFSVHTAGTLDLSVLMALAA